MGRIAFVLGVMAASIFSGSRLWPTGSMSTKMGRAPARVIISPVAKKVKGEVMTSSGEFLPLALPIFKASRARSSASVPLRAHARGEPLLQFGDFGTQDEPLVLKDAADARVHPLGNAAVLRLQVDKFHHCLIVSQWVEARGRRHPLE